jgi:hypothetical protein
MTDLKMEAAGFSEEIGTYLPNCTELHARKPWSWYTNSCETFDTHVEYTYSYFLEKNQTRYVSYLSQEFG